MTTAQPTQNSNLYSSAYNFIKGKENIITISGRVYIRQRNGILYPLEIPTIDFKQICQSLFGVEFTRWEENHTKDFANKQVLRKAILNFLLEWESERGYAFPVSEGNPKQRLDYCVAVANAIVTLSATYQSESVGIDFEFTQNLLEIMLTVATSGYFSNGFTLTFKKWGFKCSTETAFYALGHGMSLNDAVIEDFFTAQGIFEEAVKILSQGLTLPTTGEYAKYKATLLGKEEPQTRQIQKPILKGTQRKSPDKYPVSVIPSEQGEVAEMVEVIEVGATQEIVEALI